MATTDIYTHITLDEFIRAVQKHYFYRVYHLRIRTEPSCIEPHTVIPYKVTVKTCCSDVFMIQHGNERNEPYLDMEDFARMFTGIPLICISSNDFENDEDTKQVETCASFIDIDIIEYIRYSEHPELLTHPSRSYSVNSALTLYDNDMLSVIRKGNNLILLYPLFRDEMNRRQ